jgi:putative pyoverdin transport system ATP-binding/permease protein
VEIIQVLLRESPRAWRRALVLAALAGLGNAAILGIINRGATLASSGGSFLSLRLLLLFALCMIAFFVGKRYALIQSSVIVEYMLKKRLVRVSDKIRNSDLEMVESLGRGELYTKISQDTSLISQSGLIMVNAAQQSLVLIFCLGYIAWLSRLAFIATVAMVALGTTIYFKHAKSAQELLHRLKVKEAELVDALGHMVDGFKEIRLNRKKSDAVFKAFDGISDSVRDIKIDTQVNFVIDIMFSDLFFYSLLGIVVFLLPRLQPSYSALVLMTTAAILFIMGPLQLVVQAAPVFARAQAAIRNLDELEQKLDAALGVPREAFPDGNGAKCFDGFQNFALEGVRFSYAQREGASGVFSVGPLNFEVRRGETVFLVGGNGSGKTTVLKLLCGLYFPQHGAITVDGQPLDRKTMHGYRELFSTVYSDFHLFDRLYGMECIDSARVSAVLDEMQLSEKTRFENGRFTDLNLSTGQRKRLALAVALMEDKPILVFDEWAADQDPHFRQYFYDVVLKRLKAEGKTVLAVTHDDRYWPAADRVLKMDYGVIVDDRRN